MFKERRNTAIIIPLVTFTAVLLLWQYLIWLFKVPSYILPKPSEIIAAYSSMGNEALANYGTTLSEAFLGMAVGSSLGFIIGIALAENGTFRKMSLPFLIASNAVPIIAIAPIIILWFGNTILAKVMVAAFISFFPIALNTFKGLTQYEKYYFDLFKIYGASRWQFLTKYKLGNSLSYILNGLKLNATLSVIGAVVGEFVSADKGLGFAILQASYNFNSAKLWAYIILTCSIGILIFVLIYVIETLFFKKYKIN